MYNLKGLSVTTEDFFLIWDSGEFKVQKNRPDREKEIFLWFFPRDKVIKSYFPEESGQVTKMSVNRQAASIVRSGYLLPSGERIGQGFEFSEGKDQDFVKDPSLDLQGVITPSQWQEIQEERAKRGRGNLIKELLFSNVFDVIVSVYSHLIEVSDSNTKEMLTIHEIPDQEVEFAEKQSSDIVKLSMKDNSTVILQLDLFEQGFEVNTNSMTLKTIFYDLKINKGYYFGSFEFGAFSINVEESKHKIKVEEPISFMHAISAAIDGHNIIIGFQSGNIQRYGITRELQWESKTGGSVLSIIVWGNYVLSGHNDGTMQQWDKKSGSLINSWTITESGITSIVAIDEEFAVLGAEYGILVRMDLLRHEARWKITLDGGAITSIYHSEKNNQLIVQSKKGMEYNIDYQAGTIISKRQNAHTLTSNSISLGNWNVYGSNEKLILSKEGYEKITNTNESISAICEYSDGLILGSLTGKLSLWKRIGLKLIN